MPSRTASYGASGQNLSNTVTLTGTVTELSETIAPSASDFLVNIAIDVSAAKLIYIVGTGAMTLETNSSSAADNTITLVADQPYVWTNVCLMTNLLTVDVTAIYVTSTPGGTLSITVVQDATP